MMKDIAIILTPSNRSKAYLQLMERHNVLPNFCIILDGGKDLYQELDEYQPCSKEYKYFNFNEPILYTINRNNLPYLICRNNNINDIEVVNAVAKIKESIIVYSGFGGQILKSEILNTGKKFLHIHPGIVPYYRGSTTVYYSLLSEGNFGASAIFLNERIDEGPVLAKKMYDVPINIPDVDYIYDPYIRADLLVEVLIKYKKMGTFQIEDTKNPYEGETYFIIHPVLKHIAILSEVEPKRGKIKL